MSSGKCYRCGNAIEARALFWPRRRLCSDCAEVSLIRQQGEARDEVHKEVRTIGHELLGPFHDSKYSANPRLRR